MHLPLLLVGVCISNNHVYMDLLLTPTTTYPILISIDVDSSPDQFFLGAIVDSLPVPFIAQVQPYQFSHEYTKPLLTFSFCHFFFVKTQKKSQLQ
ncbi:hypothetical protein L6452_05713 [Arctium lappa]|uniref:Uncharacterized protein n=1 Tax=Arctium lappa TaxID=4217 RepID=A0ACB9EHD2_ARCLA|nr:hypothetical protein L6452_05713 [Arctium lappa]